MFNGHVSLTEGMSDMFDDLWWCLMMFDYYPHFFQIDPENLQFLVETNLPTPTTARVYVNLPEGISPSAENEDLMMDLMWFNGIWQGLVNVPFGEYWTSPYSSHYRPYT